MYTIKEIVAEKIKSVIEKLRADGALRFENLPEIVIDHSKNRAFGDYSSNAAMMLRKEANMEAREIAKLIGESLISTSPTLIEKVDVAGGGFINITLRREWLSDHLGHILLQGEQFGHSDFGEGKSILLEYVSANPTGPIHLAHARGGVIGDVLARLYRMIGYKVSTEFYINDADNSKQMDDFAKALMIRYQELLGQEVNLEELGYKGEYMIELAQELLDTYGRDIAEGSGDIVLTKFRSLGQELALKGQKIDLQNFGVEFDIWYSEQSLHAKDEVTNTLLALKESGNTFAQDGAVWLRATNFGDDKDRVLVRSNGAPTYIAADAAYHKDKLDRGYETLIDIWGPDHHGYIIRTKAVIGALGYDKDRLQIIIYQIVKVFKEGVEVKLSKRTGNVITLKELMEEIGAGAASGLEIVPQELDANEKAIGRDVSRFFLMMRSHDTDLNFNLELAKKNSDENPVFYVQYAHARIQSVITKAAEHGLKVTALNEIPKGQFKSVEEAELIKKISDFPEEIMRAAVNQEPHRLTVYAQELARTFHAFYDACRVLSTDKVMVKYEESLTRLSLCHAAGLTLRKTLETLGVSAPMKMDDKKKLPPV